MGKTGLQQHRTALLQLKNWSHVADTGKAARSITVSLAFCIFEGDSVQQGDISSPWRRVTLNWKRGMSEI